MGGSDPNQQGTGNSNAEEMPPNEITAKGKYLLVNVPDFAADTVGPRKNQQMTSFLRMGSYHERPDEDPAQKRSLELAKLAQVVTKVQGGHLTAPYGAEVNTSDTGVEGRGVFLDDHRNRDACPDGTLPVAERLEQSGVLLNRGGWWDHSDGNRVSTTYGDKVEVIRGSYKMVVMQRQDDPGFGGGWDVSGGHIQDLGPNSMPGASVRVEFRPGMFGKTGTWHLENTTNNFIQTSDYAGDFFEHWYGNLKQTTVGSEHPQEFNDALQKPYGNPEITEKTWAKKIESYTGSTNWRIPEMKEETYAVTTSALTDISGSMSETTYCDGTSTSNTGSASRPIGAVVENTYANTTNTFSKVGASNEVTMVGASMETTLAGTQGSLTLATSQVEVEVMLAKGSVSVVGITGEVSVGAKFAANIGYSREANIGDHDSIDIPKKKDVDIEELKAAVKELQVAVEKKSVSVTNNILAVQLKLTAVVVNIGI